MANWINLYLRVQPTFEISKLKKKKKKKKGKILIFFLIFNILGFFIFFEKTWALGGLVAPPLPIPNPKHNLYLIQNDINI
jgi:hypothetical protein